jgi:hypothetical protein
MAGVLLSAGAIVAAAGASPAHASAWTTSAQVSGSATYDDNVLFVADRPIHDYFGRLEATGSLQYVGAHSRLELQPRLAVYRYGSFRTLDRADQYLKASLTDTGEHGKSLVSLSGSRDTTLTSEVGSTGLTQANKRHDGLQVSWAPSYQATERFGVSALLSAQENRYRDAAQTSLLDYDYGSGSVNANYAVTSLSSVTLQASAGRLQVPGRAQYTQKNFATTLGYSRHFGESWQVDAYYGPSFIQTHGPRPTNRGDVYHLGAVRTGLRGNISLNLDQQVTPNGFGILSRRQGATLGWHYSATEHVTVGVAGQWSRIRNLLPLFGFELSRFNYNDASVNLEWTPTATWYISVTADHGNQGYSNAPQLARRTNATVAFVWTGLERVLH